MLRMPEQKSDYYITLDEVIEREGFKYRRLLAHTPWIKDGDDLAEVLKQGLGEHLKRGGTAFISEKIAVVATGRMVPVSKVKVRWLARFASKFVRPIGDDLAQSIPERMQFVIDRIGYPRTLLACAASAVTKPFGIRGAFFVIAGLQARGLDGMHGQYMDWLLPPLTPREAKVLCEEIAAKIGAPVTIADVNDRGGHIRATSDNGLSKEHLLRVLQDNPQGHKETSTPIGLIELV
jgi:F420-0:gamma-glutamyl ligase-like protein